MIITAQVMLSTMLQFKGCFLTYCKWYILKSKSFSFTYYSEYDPNTAKKANYNLSRWKSQEKKSLELDDSSTEEAHNIRLGAEVKKKNPNLQSVSRLLKDSFYFWQKWINTLQGKGTITKIVEE